MAASVKLSARMVRWAINALENRAIDPAPVVERLRAAIHPKLSKPWAKSKKKPPRSGSRSIRAAVFLRACGHCEACNNLATRSDPLTWDHAHGRVKEKESVENTWALHLSCHRRRTNGPRVEWLLKYLDHSWKHGHHAEVRWAEREIEFAKDKLKLDALRAEVAGG